MLEVKKFTQEELNEITNLRDLNAKKVTEFGQIELEIYLAEQRIANLNNAKTTAKEDYKNLQDKEQSLVQKLNEKYGAGTVDLASGEFIPSN